jgi:hypothetical protein
MGEEVFMTEGSIGNNFNRLMNSIGFPNELGNIMGAALEARIENNVSVARNLFDAFSSITPSSIDSLMAGTFGPSAMILRPHNNYHHHFALHHATHYNREQISTFHSSPEYESKLMSDPALRAAVEAQLGGRFIYDGNADGRFNIAHALPHHCIEYSGNAYQNVTAMLGRCATPLAQQKMLQSLAAALQQSFALMNAKEIIENAKLSFDQKLSELIQGTMRPSLEELLIKLEMLLNRETIQAPPPRKKKKKGGLGSKLKKGFKGIKKSVSNVGKFAKSMTKNLLKGTIKTLSGGFLKSSLLRKLLTKQLAPLFKLGTGLLGGILGGPVGPAMIAQFASGKLKPKDLLKAANPLNQMKMLVHPKQVVSFGMHQAFGQVSDMFKVANQYSAAMMDVQKLAYSRLLRG